MGGWEVRVVYHSKWIRTGVLVGFGFWFGDRMERREV